jgi:hypothetical protein
MRIVTFPEFMSRRGQVRALRPDDWNRLQALDKGLRGFLGELALVDYTEGYNGNRAGERDIAEHFRIGLLLNETVLASEDGTSIYLPTAGHGESVFKAGHWRRIEYSPRPIEEIRESAMDLDNPFELAKDPPQSQISHAHARVFVGNAKVLEWLAYRTGEQFRGNCLHALGASKVLCDAD